MALFPPKPLKGRDVLPWARSMHDYVLASTPRPAAGNIRVQRTPSGTTFASKPIRLQRFPFQVIVDFDFQPSEGDTDRRVKVRSGRLRRFGSIDSELFITAIGPGGNIFSAPGGEELDDFSVAPALIKNGETWYVTLQRVDAGVNEKSGAHVTTLNIRWDFFKPLEPFLLNGHDIHNWSKLLAVVRNVGGEVKIKQVWTGGDVQDFHLVPDTNTEHPEIQHSRVESLDYIDGAFDGSLDGSFQDRDVHESLIDATNITDQIDDFAISYFHFRKTDGITEKKYARIDTHEADLWPDDHGKSLQIGGFGPGGAIVHQIYNFHTQNVQENHDAHALYVNVNSLSNKFIEYEWPVTFEGRPRNAFDGSDATTTVITELVNFAGGLSTIDLATKRRTFTTSRATLDQGVESTADLNLSIDLNIDPCNIDWPQPPAVPDPLCTIPSCFIDWQGDPGDPEYCPPVIHHDETDPSLGNDPFTFAQWQINPDHDGRYLGVFDAFNSTVFPGTATANYHTTGEMHADDFRIEDDSLRNFWNAEDFEAFESGVISLEAASNTGTDDIKIETSGAASQIRIVSQGNVKIESSESSVNAIFLQSNSPTGDIEILSQRALKITCGGAGVEAFRADITGGIRMTAGGAFDVSASLSSQISTSTGNLGLEATGGDLILNAFGAGFLDLNTVAGLKINGTQALSQDGHTHGLLTDSAALDTHIEDLAETICLALC